MTLGHFAQSGIEIEKLQKERMKQEAKQKRQQEKEKKKRRRDAKVRMWTPVLLNIFLQTFSWSLFFPFWQKKNLSLLPSPINSEGDLKLNEGSVFTVTLDKTNQKDVAVNLADSTTNSFNKGQTNLAYQADTNMSDSDSDHSYEEIPEISYHGGEGDPCRSGLHSVILDVSTTSFVDTVTVKMLKNVRLGWFLFTFKKINNKKTVILFEYLLEFSIYFRFSGTSKQLIWTFISPAAKVKNTQQSKHRQSWCQNQSIERFDNERIKVSASVVPRCSLWLMEVKHWYIITIFFLLRDQALFFFSPCLFVSKLSLCGGAAGKGKLLLRVCPKEQTVCLGSWCCASHPE